MYDFPEKMPKVGGVRDLSNVKLRDDFEITRADLYSQKHSFATEDEFKYLVSHYFDAVRRKKGLTVTQMAKRMNKAESSFNVMKYDGVSTFELFFKYCRALGIDPVLTLNKCLKFFSEFRKKLLQ